MLVDIISAVQGSDDVYFAHKIHSFTDDRGNIPAIELLNARATLKADKRKERLANIYLNLWDTAWTAYWKALESSPDEKPTETSESTLSCAYRKYWEIHNEIERAYYAMGP